MNKYIIIGIGLVIGAIAGFLYWNQIGCLTGSCSITSVWYNSTAYGAIMGGIAGTFFVKEKPKQESE